MRHLGLLVWVGIMVAATSAVADENWGTNLGKAFETAREEQKLVLVYVLDGN